MADAADELTLDDLLERIRACRLCRDTPRGRRPLPHEPRPVVRATTTARLAICGQAPGTRVHASGMPFSDPSGDRLRDWMGIAPETFYDATRIAIVPMGFCFPGLDAKGGDRPPRPECALYWRDDVFRRLPALQVVLLVGQYAQRWHLPEESRGGLTRTVADWRAIAARHSSPLLIPLPHPSWRNNGWLRKHPWFAAELLPFVRAAVASAVA